MVDELFRNFFLSLSKSKALNKLAKKQGLKYGAKRFIAGETIEQAVPVIQKLNGEGISTTIDYVGENVYTKVEADRKTDEILKAIEQISKHQLDSQISIKLTSLGLDVSRKVVLTNLEHVMEKAKAAGVFVTIDMEDYGHCQQTLNIFTELAKRYDNVGPVIQSYLYRSVQDVRRLEPLAPRIRFVKGAYKESPQVAFAKKQDVDENFKKLISMHLLNGHYTMIATHDDAMIDFAKRFVEENAIPKNQFEFQMLYGICTDKQYRLVQEGYQMRVYLPYGRDWYGYFVRRLAERPANLAFVLKGIFGK